MQVWLYALLAHFLSLPLYGVALFLPTIISELGYTASAAQLLTVPPYALATILTILVAVAANRVGHRDVFVMVFSTLAVVGYIILLSNKTPKKHLATSYVGSFLVAAGIYPSIALALSWPALNVAGATWRATANGMQISCGNVGAIIVTQIYRTSDGPRFVRGHAVALRYSAATVCCSGVLGWVLRRENRTTEEGLGRVVDGGSGERGGKAQQNRQWRFLA